MRKRNLMIVGFVFIFWAIFLAFRGFSKITGLVVLENANEPFLNLTAILFFVMGVFLMIASNRDRKEGIEERVEVYDASNGKKRDDESLRMTDPELEFGKEGYVTLSKFKKVIGSYKSEEGGEELVEIIRNIYGHALHQIRDGDNKERAEIAGRFLEVLEGPIEERGEEYQLPREERRKIKDAFRGWNGRVNYVKIKDMTSSAP